MLLVADYILFIIHILIIGINLFGWIHPKTRKLHFGVVGLTLFSWVVLGFWKGFGYCFLTDWEWDIKRQLGEKNLPGSFIRYLTNNVMGLNLDRITVDLMTAISFVIAILIAITIFVRGRLKRS